MMLEMMLLATDTEVVREVEGGLSNFDRAGILAILTAIGTALGSALRWIWVNIKPMMDQALENQSQNAAAISKFATAHAITAHMQQAFVKRFSKTRRCILIVEDDRSQTALLATACMRLGRRGRLAVVTSPTLQSSFEHLPDAAVVILDVVLPDATKADVQEFVYQCTDADCPVVIHSARDYTALDFPTAAAILKKGTSLDVLYRDLEAIINRSRPELEPAE